MPCDQARAFWIAAPGRGEIRTERIAAPAPHEVEVRALFSGISRGTEALVFEGRVPASERARMAAPFQAGAFPAPVKYGYASVGVVDRGPAELEGRSVFVLYPHQTCYVVPASAVHLLPEGVPADRAVLAANLETAVNGVWDAGIRIGDRVTVVGAGTVGSMAAWLAGRVGGCDVELIDVNRARASIAGALGVRFATPDAASAERDVVIHASGSPSGLQRALEIAGFEATIVELSWYGDRPVTVPLGEAFHARRLILRSSQVGSVATAQRARWDPRRRMNLVLSLLADPALDALITGESPFEDLPQTMARLTSEGGDTIFHRVRYD